MFQPVPAFIAMRYSRAGKHNSFVAFINRFSVAGIALGLMALIIVLSVMNGFESQLKQRILGIVPHISVHDVPVKDVENINLPGAVALMPYLEAEAIVQSRYALRGVQLQGVTPALMEKHSVVASSMVTGRFSDLTALPYSVVISRALALELEVRPGDTLRLIAAGASVYTPFGRMPSQRLVTISGLFSIGSQLDDKAIFMSLTDMKKILRLKPDSQADTRVFLADAFNYQAAVDVLTQHGMDSTTWRTRQGPLFDAVKMEKNMMFLMLLLIIAVAAFNIVSALVMVVSEKQGDIAILLTQGLSRKRVMSIFLLNGLYNGLKGGVIGLVLGLIVVFQINNVLDILGIPIALSADGRGLPVDLRWHQVIIVSLFSLLLCLLASVYPALRASKVSPARALQDE